MLSEEQRVILPAAVARLVQWDKVEACVIICKGKKGTPNNIVMSSLSAEELSFLIAQAQAHLTGLLIGSLSENLPAEEIKP